MKPAVLSYDHYPFISTGDRPDYAQNLAIVRNAAVVLSLPSAGLLRHHKSRFLAETDEGFWVESVPAERQATGARWLRGAQCAGLAIG